LRVVCRPLHCGRSSHGACSREFDAPCAAQRIGGGLGADEQRLPSARLTRVRTVEEVGRRLVALEPHDAGERRLCMERKLVAARRSRARVGTPVPIRRQDVPAQPTAILAKPGAVRGLQARQSNGRWDMARSHRPGRPSRSSAGRPGRAYFPGPDSTLGLQTASTGITIRSTSNTTKRESPAGAGLS